MKKILNFGSLNVDIVYNLSHFAMAGETIAASKREVFPGGKGLNQSVAISRAGAKVFHAGKISPQDKWLVDLLLSAGADITHLSQNGTSSGSAIIQLVPSGENSIIVDHGANFEITKEEIDEVLSNFEKGDCLLIQNEINNVSYILSKAAEKGMEIALNPSPVDEKLKNLDLSMVSYLILNEIEGEALSEKESPKEICNALLEKYPNLKIVLTLGKNGVMYKDKENTIFQNAFKVNATDTTGAGDTFTGYFLACLAIGKAVKEALKLASKAAAIAVTSKGAASSIPKMEDVLTSQISEN